MTSLELKTFEIEELEQRTLLSGSGSSDFFESGQITGSSTNFAADGSGDAGSVSPLRRMNGRLGAGDEGWPKSAYDSVNDQFLVVWQDRRFLETESLTVIYGQLMDADGTKIGRNFLINRRVSSGLHPGVAFNPVTNQYLVVWADGRAFSTRGWEIFGQRISSSGNRVGSNFRISSSTHDEEIPAVEYNSANNNFMVVWVDGRDTATDQNEIYIKRVSATGTPLGLDTKVSGAKRTLENSVPSLAYNSKNNQFLVVFSEGTSGGTDQEIFGQRISGGGGLIGGNIRISTNNTSPSRWPEVAYNSVNNQFLVVWFDARNVNQSWNIYGQRIAGSGKKLGGNFKITSSPSLEIAPDVTYDSTNNEYRVVFAQITPGNGTTDIHSQRVGAFGSLVGNNTRIGGGDKSDENPIIVYGENVDLFLIAWVDDRNEDRDIYAQIWT